MTEPVTPPAHDHLALAARSGLDTSHDRRIHAAAMAGFGVATGLLPLLLIGSAVPQTALLIAYVVLLSVFSAWQARAASVPRHTARISWIGAALSVVLVGAGLAVLNAVDPATWWQDTLVFLVVAAPMVAAGALIARGGTTRRPA